MPETTIKPEIPQSLILHSYRRCPYAIRVRMTLEEKELSYSVIEEKLSLKSEALLRLHPEGRVPLLLHGTQVLYESSIITEYIDDRFPDPPLMPHSAEGKAQARLWTYSCNTVFKPAVDAYKYQWKELDQTEKDGLKKKLLNYLARLENSLKQNPFLLGETLTLADIHVFPFFRQVTLAEKTIPELHESPILNHWLSRITSRPSFQATMAKKT